MKKLIVDEDEMLFTSEPKKVFLEHGEHRMEFAFRARLRQHKMMINWKETAAPLAEHFSKMKTKKSR